MPDINRKYFWIPLVLAFWFYVMLSTTPFKIDYHPIGILGIIGNIWLATFIGEPRLLPVNLYNRFRNTTRIKR